MRALAVPYRSQLDGSPYQDANCGPSSVGMVLAAYGKAVPTLQIREYVNEVQDTVGNYDSGSFIESLWDATAHYGLEPSGLFTGARGERGKTALRRWSTDEVRAELDAGHPLVRRSSTGHCRDAKKLYEGDHFIVLIGYAGDEVIYNDPMDKDGVGASRRMSWATLDRTWGTSAFPYAGLAVRGPSERPSLLAGVTVVPIAAPVRPGAAAKRAPAPGDMPLASYPGTWNARIAGVE